MSKDPLVVFTPSGKRGNFPVGTPILTAARQLGVDLDSVCGGRGICSKCQITPSYGEFPKHGVTARDGALSDWNAVEQRYDDKRGLAKGRRLGCQATVQGDIVIDVPPESQVHRQVVRKAASTRAMVMDPATRPYYVEVAEPDMHTPTGDLERLAQALKDQWGIEDPKDLAIINGKFEGPHGDRRQEIVFIGTDLKADAISKALNACLLTKKELKHYKFYKDGGWP